MTKSNLAEIRAVAYRYAFLLTEDESYIEMMEKDPANYVRKKVLSIKNGNQ